MLPRHAEPRLARFPETADRGGNVLVRQNHVRFGPDVTNEMASPNDVGRHLRLEPAAADEHDDRVKRLRAQLEDSLDRLHVPEVLMQRILKGVRVPKDGLCPPLPTLIAEDPALHVLRLDDEDTERRHDHVVDLRGTVERRKGQVVERPVVLPRQTESEQTSDTPLAGDAAEPSRAKDEAREHQGRDSPEYPDFWGLAHPRCGKRNTT